MTCSGQMTCPKSFRLHDAAASSTLGCCPFDDCGHLLGNHAIEKTLEGDGERGQAAAVIAPFGKCAGKAKRKIVGPIQTLDCGMKGPLGHRQERNGHEVYGTTGKATRGPRHAAADDPFAICKRQDRANHDSRSLKSCGNPVSPLLSCCQMAHVTPANRPDRSAAGCLDQPVHNSFNRTQIGPRPSHRRELWINRVPRTVVAEPVSCRPGPACRRKLPILPQRHVRS